MTRGPLTGICLAAALLHGGVAVAAAAAPVGAAPEARAHTLVIGKVSSNPRKHYLRLKPMVDYVAERMGALGITRGEVLMARDNAQMIQYLREGRVDWVTETLYSAVLYERAGVAESILRKWKKGVAEYRTLFFTRMDSDIRTLADLRGRRLGLEDPGSTTAFFEPLMILRDEGLEAAPLAGPRVVPPPDKVGYALAGGEINLVAWVYKGLVDAAAYNDLDWNNPDHTPEALRRELRVFHVSEPLPRAIELVRSSLDPRVRARLTELLLAAAEDPAARSVLWSYQRTGRFERIDGEMREAIRAYHGVLGEEGDEGGP
ncbi:MAG: phosphate/phosphite/phosphonate ABC transporter substrate-binding protein [Gammaproteobacteria bacterium]|nr:phosphate/phosphite/phosphonate ABC transporter substrate-binding protein [Gammaproteobacteria bacterium]